MKILLPHKLALMLVFAFLLSAFSSDRAYSDEYGCKDEVHWAVCCLMAESTRGGSLEISVGDLEHACVTAVNEMEAHDSVLKYELPISAPDDQLFCIPFLCSQTDLEWRFMVLIQKNSSGKIALYNLRKEELQQMIQDMYNLSIYHFEPDDL